MVGGGGVPRVNMVAASRRGDVVALAAGAEGGTWLLHGAVHKPQALERVASPVEGYEVRRVEFNVAGDCVLVLGGDCLAVGSLPPRAGAWSWSVPVAAGGGAEARLVEARWHAYADDHVAVLDASGRLRLFDATEAAEPVAETEASGARAFCFGASASGWGRLSVMLVTPASVVAACPVAPRRCALPMAAARGMAGICRRNGWHAALEWLERSAASGDEAFVTLRSSGGGVPARTAATLGREALAVANAAPHFDGSSLVLAIAYRDGLVEIGLAEAASRPTLDDDLPQPTPFVVLDALLVAPDNAQPRALWAETPAAALCYATDSGVALVDVPWLRDVDRTLAAGEIVERATCRHVVADAETAVAGVAFAADDVLVWFEDGAVASVSASAARFYAKLVEVDASRVDDVAAASPRLSDALASALASARAALEAVPKVAADTEAEALAALLEARAHLETACTAPVAEAAQRAEALAKILSMTRDSQRSQLDGAVRRATAAAAKLDDLSRLGSACADRASSLSQRADAAKAAAAYLQPNLSKADLAYHADVLGLADRVDRARCGLAAAASRADRLLATPPQHQPDVSLSNDNVGLCHQLLQAQFDLLHQANADILQLKHKLVES